PPSSRPAARVAARASAAKPDAEEARPAPVGKSLPVITRAWSVMPAISRTFDTKARILRLAACPPDAAPPSSSTSSLSAPKCTLVRVDRPPKVMEIDPTSGRLSAASVLGRLPQYLTRAMLLWATAVTDIRGSQHAITARAAQLEPE